MSKEPFENDEILMIIFQVCIAVYYMHQKGIGHRDLKPGNILIKKLDNGTKFYKLCDFGISKNQSIA
jgi:serine/threonine protein kinase